MVEGKNKNEKENREVTLKNGEVRVMIYIMNGWE